ncbi:WSC containing protein [Cladorrhinum samala]|uniref:WSC containing protein n=1 Tax=Cladorrhinum samala TaxID=585594 RepID=A0AAV9HL43_9PEZI|nr:WSC containing protein [Cladorrhinum samala]
MASTHLSLRQLLSVFPIFTTAINALASQHIKREPPVATSLGCHYDNVGDERAIEASSYAADDMTVESCIEFCANGKHPLAAVSYGRECFCGETLSAGNVAAPEADCSFACAGNPLEKCGAGNRINLYSIQNVPVRGPADLPGVTSLGCFVDTPTRVFPFNLVAADDMTAAKCRDHCAGFSFFGTQYSRECFCGTSAPTISAPASDCSMACAGDDNEVCGAGMRLNAYYHVVGATSTTARTSTAASLTPRRWLPLRLQLQHRLPLRAFTTTNT